MARSKSQGAVYVATESFACQIGDEYYNVTKGERVREGHALLRAAPGAFENVQDAFVQYDVEQATAAPGEKRGA